MAATTRTKLVDRAKGLVLRKADLRKNTAALFDAMERDEKLKTKFVEDPVGILSQRVFKSKLPAQQASEANRLLFAMLQNDRFVKWLDDYSQKNRDRKVPKEEFAQEFARAVIDHGDPIILTAVMRNAIAGFGIPGIDVAQQVIINNAAGTAVATRVNQSSTSDASLRSSQNFTTSSSANTHTNTRNTGIGFGLDVVSSVAMRTILEQLILRAKDLARQGALAGGRL